MKIYQRFLIYDYENIINFFINEDVDYKISETTGTCELFLYEDNKKYKTISNYLAKYKIHPYSFHIEFSQQDRDEAEWMIINSRWHNGFPQPSSPSSRKFFEITYDISNMCNHCLKGIVQQDDFKIKSAPKWKDKRQSFELYWIYDEIFISQHAATILMDNNIKGVEYRSVSTRNKVLDCTKQMYVNNFLKPGLMQESINQSISTLPCPHCGENKYCLKHGYVYYDRNVFNNVDVDIIKTGENFGAEGACAKYIIINQRFYQILVANKLDTSFSYIPLQLV